MKLVILTFDEPIQSRLCHLLAAEAEVAAIVLSQNIPRKPPPLGRQLRLLSSRVQGRLLGTPLRRAWRQLNEYYARRYGPFPAVETLRVRNVNDAGTAALIARLRPDLVVVSGTNLVGKAVIDTAQRHARCGIVNMHTGISPYVKGGPNCTNWCLAQGWFGLIGATVMWLDPGIDTGDLIATEQTPLTGHEDLFTLHLRVMEHAQGLYARAIRAILRGDPVRRVPQREIGEGTTFYNHQWDGLAMARAWLNYRLSYSPRAFGKEYQRQSAALRLVPLPDAHPAPRADALL